MKYISLGDKMLTKEISNDFPTVKTVNYLSTASIGLVPNPVTEKTLEFSEDLDKKGTLTLSEEKEVMVYDNLRTTGSELFECDAQDIAVFNSVTEALNSIAWSLDIGKGKIISTNIEFPSITYPWLRIADKNQNIQVELINADNWCISTEDIIEAIDEETRVVFLSHVEYLTGQQYDLKKITKYAHDFGALVVVDGIQAAGYIPLNMKELGVDVYITGSYKWLLAPFGTAIAYISKDLCDTLTPVFVGWRSAEDMWSLNPVEFKYPITARKFEYSTSAYGVKVGLAESIKYLQKIGIEKIHSHNMKLTERLVKELESMERIEIITPENRGSILTFKISDKASQEVNSNLKRMEKPVELTIRQNMVRVSPHLYNTDSDITHFINSLIQILN